MKQIKIQFGTLAIFGLAAMMSSGLTSCSKSSSPTTTPPPTVTTIDGYDSSGAIASTNLVAYFPLNGNGNDVVGNETGTVTNGTSSVSWVTGVIANHQAYQGDTTGTYITCPANANLATLRSVSVSVWVKTPVSAKKPGQGTPGTAAQGIFFMGTTTVPNELMLENDNNDSNQRATDSADFHFGLDDPGTGTNYQGFVPDEFGIDTAANGWMHLVMTYDSSTSNLTEYVNGVAVGAKTAFSNNLYVSPNQLLNGPTGSGIAIGSLNYSSSVPTTITIGTWPVSGLYGLGAPNSFAGAIAELRIYNRGLSATEVEALYANGKAGQ
jgi:hypothetical protein